MGLKDRFKKIFKSDVKEDEEIPQTDKTQPQTKEEDKKPVYKIRKPVEDVDIKSRNDPVLIETFSELDDLIRRGRDEIVLGCDIVLGDDDYYLGIPVDKYLLTIDGDGHSIDASAMGRIFNIQKGKILLKNITFKNGLCNSGAAIQVHDATVNIIGCSFESNSARQWGGALNNINGEVNIVDCEFRDNSSTFGGALNNFKGILTVNDSGFALNDAVYGGAIRSRSTLEISKSEFIKNSSANSIICSHGLSVIESSRFNENAAKNIIYNESKAFNPDLTIISTEFLKNSAANSVIFTDSKHCEISNSTFNNSSSKVAIENDSKLILNNTTIEDDSKIINRGDVVLKNRSADLKERIESTNTIEIDEKTEGLFDFGYLEDLISKSNGEIVLSEDIQIRDYESFSYEEGIILEVESLVIDGDAHTIDAGGLSRIFNITSGNITLKNMTLRGGFCKNGGGAILNSANLTIIDCIFEENKSGSMGDIIYNESTSTLDVEGSSFVSLHSSYGNSIYGEDNAVLSIRNSILNGADIRSNGTLDLNGCDLESLQIKNFAKASVSDSIFKNARISNEADLSVERCDFKFQKSADKSGVIKSSKTAVIRNCDFSDITGTVISNKGDLRLCGCNFKANSFESLPAISNSESLEIRTCNFTENTSRFQTFFNEGRMEVHETEISDNHYENASVFVNEGNLTLEASYISNNHFNGGITAVNAKNCSLKIDGCSIENNNPDAAILNNGILSIEKSFLKKNSNVLVENEKRMRISECEITENTSSGNMILNHDFTELHNNSFTGNASECMILTQNSEELSSIDIVGCSFAENDISSSIIYNDSKSCFIDQSEFTGNSIRGNAIRNVSSMTLNNVNIEEGTKAILNEGSISIKKDKYGAQNMISGPGEIITSTIPRGESFDFTYLDGLIHGSGMREIVLDRDITFKNYEMDFFEGGIELDVDDMVIDGKGITIDAASKTRIFHVTGKNITIKNIIFKNGHSHKNYNNPFNSDGAAIFTVKCTGLTVINCKFMDSTSERCAGSIRNNGNLKVKDCIFQNNESHIGAGALLNCGDMILDGCTFDSNRARRAAGAIHNAGDLKITGSTLNANSVSNGGGGAIANRGTLTIEESSINDNTAINGGAIFSDSMLHLTRCSLEDNSAQSGGAICNMGFAKVTLWDCSMKNNTAESLGGVLSNLGGEVSLRKCILKSNVSDKQKNVLGGAIFNEGYLQVSSSCFIDNGAYMGGSIYNRNSYLSINSACLFADNSAGWGGAIYDENGSLHLMNSTFRSNISRSYGGAVLAMRQKDVRVKSCDFEHNIPDDIFHNDQ